MTSQIVLPQGVLGQGQQIVIPGQTNGQGPPIVIPAQALPANTAANERKFNTTAGLVTGILQLLIGIIEVIATAIAISLGSEYRWFWGIWAGIGLYGLGGVLGVISKSCKNKGVVVAYMVFSIISSFVAPCHMIYEAVASSNRGFIECGYCDSAFSFYDSCDEDCYTTNGPAVAHGIAATVAAVEMFVAIVAACYGCCGTCCAGSCATGSTSVTQGQTYIIQYTQGTQPQTVTTTPNHQVTYPSAPANLGYTTAPRPADPPPAYAPLGPGVSTSQPYQSLSAPTTAQPQPYESLGPDATRYKPYQDLSSPSASSQPHHYSTRVETSGQRSAPPAEDPLYIEIDQ